MPPLIQSWPILNVTSWSIKVKRITVVNRPIFRFLKSKNWQREIPYNTKPVNLLLDYKIIEAILAKYTTNATVCT